MKTVDVLFIGHLNCDIVAEGIEPQMLSVKQSYIPPIIINPGGDAQNCSLTFSRLGLKASVIGKIGKDYQGMILKNILSNSSIDISNVVECDEATGTCLACLNNGEASFIAHSGANSSLCNEDVSFNALLSAKTVSINSIFGCGSLNGEVLKKAKEYGCETFADTTSVPEGKSLEDIKDFLENLDYFVPSEAEITKLCGTDDFSVIAKQLHTYGIKTVIIKAGEKGCFLSNANFEGFIPGFKVDVVDTTGCGDNFVACFLSAHLRGYSDDKACLIANAGGAINATRKGANGAVTSFEQLEEFIKRS